MSLAEDFNMYFGGTYVGLADQHGVIRPFWVTSVARGRDFNNNDYSEAAVNALRFTGTHYRNEDMEEEKTVPYGKLVLEMPDLGYIEHRGKFYYLTWRPTRSTKKGLCDRRISGVNRLDYNFVRSIYETVHKNPNPLARQFCIQEGKVAYKGYLIGTVDNKLLKIAKKFKYLLPFINKTLEEGYVAQEEVENNG